MNKNEPLESLLETDNTIIDDTNTQDDTSQNDIDQDTEEKKAVEPETAVISAEELEELRSIKSRQSEIDSELADFRKLKESLVPAETETEEEPKFTSFKDLLSRVKSEIKAEEAAEKAAATQEQKAIEEENKLYMAELDKGLNDLAKNNLIPPLDEKDPESKAVRAEILAYMMKARSKDVTAAASEYLPLREDGWKIDVNNLSMVKKSRPDSGLRLPIGGNSRVSGAPSLGLTPEQYSRMSLSEVQAYNKRRILAEE